MKFPRRYFLADIDLKLDSLVNQKLIEIIWIVLKFIARYTGVVINSKSLEVYNNSLQS